MDNAKDLLLIENLVKLASLQKLLIKKGLLTEQEITDEMTAISKELVEQIKTVTPDVFASLTKN